MFFGVEWSLLPGFGIGRHTAYFQLVGKVPCVIKPLKIDGSRLGFAAVAWSSIG